MNDSSNAFVVSDPLESNHGINDCLNVGAGQFVEFDWSTAKKEVDEIKA